MSWSKLEERFTKYLSLTLKPVAITLLKENPANVAKFEGNVPAGCSFWSLAAGGQAFYTVPSDHYNCAVGAYTHNIALPAERSGEWDEMKNLMHTSGYLKAIELPTIAKLHDTPTAIVYSPLGDTPTDPDVVLFACKARAAMLLNEATLRTLGSSATTILGRPTCMLLAVAQADGVAISLGCAGNRIYTQLEEDYLYVAIRGSSLQKVAGALAIIVNANETMIEYARAHAREFSAGQ